MKNYTRVNRDTLKTKEKCLKVAEEEIKKGNSVVIDNTNPSAADRKIYIDLAIKYKIKVRCFYFDIPKDICFHLNE
jgi:bifunctional polynucleotide phosphatase/kinase